MKTFLRILIVLLLSFCFQSGKSQNAYYHALKLSQYVSPVSKKIAPRNDGEKDTIKSILKHHGYLVGESNSNPFIDPLIDEGGLSAAAGAKENLFNISSALQGVGGLNVTNVADGLAKFLVDRAKQELSLAFFDEFKNELGKSDELKMLFPQTKKVLDVIGDQIYLYSNYLNSLREAFNNDLNNLLINLEKYVDTKVSDSNVSEPIGDALFFTNQIKNGEHPGDATNQLANRSDAYTSTDYLKFRESLQVLNAISQSLTSRSDSKYWIPSDSLRLLFEEKTFTIYLGLMYQKHKDLKIAGKTFGNYLTDFKDKTDELKPPIRGFVNAAQSLESSIKSIKKQKDNGEKVASYFEVFNNTTDLIVRLTDFMKLIDPRPDDAIAQFNQYVYVAGLINGIYLDINEKQYSSLIIELVALGDTLNIKNAKGEEAFNGKFLKYGSFIANVAQAESSDQVQSAIEAIALPVGSASIKKKSEKNISLNAYLGLSPGMEWDTETHVKKSSFSFGLHAPVGVAFSSGKYDVKPNGKFEEKGSSTWFISLVDIGAFSAFRFKNDSTENLPKVTLANIFAPGVYHVWGLKDKPVSFGIGAQLGPQIRELKASDAVINENVVVSFKAFLSVDIPLINFFTKPR